MFVLCEFEDAGFTYICCDESKKLVKRKKVNGLLSEFLLCFFRFWMDMSRIHYVA